jgi:predicted DNA-binding protein (MmcQ/YjbR family)
MAYTEEQRRAFHSIVAPKGFGVELIDNEFFLTIRADEKQFLHLSHDEKIDAAMYLNRLKKALEQEGAIVQVVRKALDK